MSVEAESFPLPLVIPLPLSPKQQEQQSTPTDTAVATPIVTSSNTHVRRSSRRVSFPSTFGTTSTLDPLSPPTTTATATTATTTLPNRRKSGHARRPSRSERHEAIVEKAREALARGGDTDKRSSMAENQEMNEREKDVEAGEKPTDEDWRRTAENLLMVIDGMARQLATHDELAAQLKIAQSNLTLAGAHSDFLEDTLRRRDALSFSTVAQNLRLDQLNGGGVVMNGEKEGFFNGLKRKATLSAATALAKSSPNLSNHSGEWVSEANAAVKTPEEWTTIVGELQSSITALKASQSAIVGSNAALKGSASTLIVKCAELEKSNNDLMADMENLSVELFEEANKMVVDERKAKSLVEAEVKRLEEELEQAKREIKIGTPTIETTSSSSSSRIEPVAIPTLPNLSRRPSLTHSEGRGSSNTSRKWYTFGRSEDGSPVQPPAVVSTTPSTSLDIPRPHLTPTQQSKSGSMSSTFVSLFSSSSPTLSNEPLTSQERSSPVISAAPTYSAPAVNLSDSRSSIVPVDLDRREERSTPLPESTVPPIQTSKRPTFTSAYDFPPEAAYPSCDPSSPTTTTPVYSPSFSSPPESASDQTQRQRVTSLGSSRNSGLTMNLGLNARRGLTSPIKPSSSPPPFSPVTGSSTSRGSMSMVGNIAGTGSISVGSRDTQSLNAARWKEQSSRSIPSSATATNTRSISSAKSWARTGESRESSASTHPRAASPVLEISRSGRDSRNSRQEDTGLARSNTTTRTSATSRTAAPLLRASTVSSSSMPTSPPSLLASRKPSRYGHIPPRIKTTPSSPYLGQGLSSTSPSSSTASTPTPIPTSSIPLPPGVTAHSYSGLSPTASVATFPSHRSPRRTSSNSSAPSSSASDVSSIVAPATASILVNRMTGDGRLGSIPTPGSATTDLDDLMRNIMEMEDGFDDD